MNFSKKIINWYKNNHRKLPWRETKNPYYILVSEFMLQKTKVSKTIKYYLDFVKKFPDIEKLAHAEEQEVLKKWEGLGYYARARYLHLFAKQLVKKNPSGFFPKTYKELIKYKGIGPYTGAAVASICFDEVIPALDGNAYRVFSRYLGIYHNITSFGAKNIFRFFILKIMDHNDPGIFNQAIMDLGSTLCTPRKAKCFSCPVKYSCFSFKNGTVYDLPVKNIIKKPITHRFFYYVFIWDKKNNHLCIQKRNNKDIWKGLYDFPLIESEKNLSISEIKDKIWTKFRIISDSIIYQIIHKLTHQTLSIQFLNCRIIQNIQKEKYFDNFFFIPHEKIVEYPFPRPITLFLKHEKMI
ncbi:A/G-specific adenine glycosylase [Blattabacterium cuenoti]|uniref:A/G-specific adenine glycosylase n=1 Tax=Blattabacterium cuenoti TaxID=1653831 RepID=UPI00163CD439|nr:A/G-specific adenine glycosylase [Blattabacterium cuenoti]